MPYLEIPVIVEKTLNAVATSPANSVERILDIDAQARKVAHDFVLAATP